MQVDIYADTICPWCLIGRTRFLEALAARPALRADVRWRAYQLNPDMPAAGIPWNDYLVAKFGSLAKGRRSYDQIAEAGRIAGIRFRFDRIACVPNTFDSHRLVQLAADYDLTGRALDAVYEAYFVDGEDIGDADTLAAIGRAIGLPPSELDGFFDTDLYRDDVWSQDRRARRLGLEGVPTFLFEGRFAVAGAQDAEVFTALFDLDAGQLSATARG